MVLDCCDGSAGRMAYAGRADPDPAVGRMACRREDVVRRDRTAVLVAGRAAVAERAGAAMVDGGLPVSRDAAVRHLVRVSGVLRAHCLLGIPVDARPYDSVGARRSGGCRRLDVDGGHARLL